MDIRVSRNFGIAFGVSFATLFLSWIVLDGFLNLDEFLVASGHDRSWVGVAVLHYQGVIALHGSTLLGSVVLASVAVGGMIGLRR